MNEIEYKVLLSKFEYDRQLHDREGMIPSLKFLKKKIWLMTTTLVNGE